MTAHQKLIQRHSPKWDQTDMPVFHLKAPDMFPEFRMDIKIQRDIFLFQKSLKPLILQKCFITLIVFTFFLNCSSLISSSQLLHVGISRISL